MFLPGMGTYPPSVKLTLPTPAKDFHIVLDGIDPGTTVFVAGLRCRSVKLFLIRGWHLILPVWRWSYKPKVVV